MKTKGLRKEIIEVEIVPFDFLMDLFKEEFMGYDLYDDFKIEDDKLYVYTDVSYHISRQKRISNPYSASILAALIYSKYTLQQNKQEPTEAHFLPVFAFYGARFISASLRS